MKEKFDLVIGEDGSIESIYQDGLAEALGATTTEVKRASNVEWETVNLPTTRSGWVVRAAHDNTLAIRAQFGDVKDSYYVGREGVLAMFESREDALREEVRFFWDLVKEK